MLLRVWNIQCRLLALKKFFLSNLKSCILTSHSCPWHHWNVVEAFACIVWFGASMSKVSRRMCVKIFPPGIWIHTLINMFSKNRMIKRKEQHKIFNLRTNIAIQLFFLLKTKKSGFFGTCCLGIRVTGLASSSWAYWCAFSVLFFSASVPVVGMYF